MADAFGAGMALGFQALSAKRQREQGERQQEQFDLLMGERDKDIKAQNAAKVFMGEASNVNDPEALMKLYHQHLPNFLDSPTAFTQASTFVKTHPSIMQSEGVNKLDQEIAKEKWKMDYQNSLQRGRMEYGASLKGTGTGWGAGTGGAMGVAGSSKGGAGTGKAAAANPKRDIKEINVIVGRDEAGQPIYEQRTVFADTGVETHTLSPGGVPVLNFADPIVQEQYGDIDSVKKALRLLSPDLTDAEVNEAAHRAYNTPTEIKRMIGDYNRLLPFKAPAGTPGFLRQPQATGGPRPYEGMEPMKKNPVERLDEAVETPPGATTLRTLYRDKIAPALNRGAPMIPEAQAITGFGGEEAPTTPALSRLAPVATPGLASLPGQYDKPLARYRNVPVKEAVTMAYDAIKKQGMTDLADLPKLNQAFEEVLQGTEDAAIDQLQNAIPRVLARLWADTKALGEIDEEANERAQQQLLTLMKTPGNALNALYRSIFNAFDYMGKGVVRGVEALGEIPTPLQVERR